MKILQTSKNGQVTQAIKNNDYSTFTVHYNKKVN